MSEITDRTELTTLAEDDEFLVRDTSAARDKRVKKKYIAPFIDVRQFGAVADFNPLTGSGTDNYTAFKNAIATGRNVYVPAGDIIDEDDEHQIRYGYRIHEFELLLKTKGQILFGDGMGASYGSNQGEEHSSLSGLFFTGTGDTYIHTRRLPRASVSDPQDDPISTAINIEHEGIEIRDLSVNLYCDYTNETASNLGDDWDVGIFNGNRPQCKLTNVRVIGYWRKAALYWDNTSVSNIPPLEDADGVAYPEGSYNGLDQNYLTNVFTSGGHKGFFLAGPIFDTANYYDQQLGTTVSDKRGIAGASDSHFLNCNFFGPDHHSFQRRVDPLSPLDFSSEDIDELACAVAIDGAGQVTFDYAVRRLLFTNCRIQTFEAVRIAIVKGQEIRFINLHTEPFPGFTVTNTSGAVIDHDDETTHDYGPVAVQVITNDTTRTRGIYFDGINGNRLPNTQWFDDVLTTGFQFTNVYNTTKSSAVFNDFDRSEFHNDVTINDTLAVNGATSIAATLTVSSTDDGASEGPLIDLHRNSATPAASDIIGSVRYIGEDSGGNQTIYGSIRGAIVDTTDTSEDGALRFLTRVAGTNAERMILEQGLRVGSPTGGDNGVGTINAVSVYDDDVLLTDYVFKAAVAGDYNIEDFDNAVPNRTHVIEPKRKAKKVRRPVFRTKMEAEDVWDKEKQCFVRKLVEKQIPVKRRVNVLDENGVVIARKHIPKLEEIEIPEQEEKAEIEERFHEPARRFKKCFDELDPEKYASKWQETHQLPAFTRGKKVKSTGACIQALIETCEVQAVHIEKLRQEIEALKKG